MSIEWHEESAFRAALDDLTALLVGEEPLQTVLRRVVELACNGIGECDLASVTFMRDGRPETIIFTEPAAHEIDQAQYSNDSGPCLAAFHRSEVISVPSMSENDEWIEFRDAALARGVRSSFSLPMATGEVRVGALNLYARTDDAFNSVPPDAALLFAKQAAAAVWTSRTQERTRDVVTQLENALDTREQIGIAIGIVMANERLTSEEAFARLVRASQHRNVKLRDIAAAVAATGETPT